MAPIPNASEPTPSFTVDEIQIRAEIALVSQRIKEISQQINVFQKSLKENTGDESLQIKLTELSEERTHQIANMTQLRSQLPSKTQKKPAIIPYMQQRLSTFNDHFIAQKTLYPHTFYPTATVYELLKLSETMKQEEDQQEALRPTVNVGGRIMAKRSASSKLHFLDLQSNGSRIQVVSALGNYQGDGGPNAFNQLHAIMLNKGDQIGVVGQLGWTKTGTWSIFASDLILLAPCFHMLPNTDFTNPESRARARHIDLIVNSERLSIFHKRAQTIKFLRNYLDNFDFLEVNTAILHTQAGGATAKPFQTFLNELNCELFLRIAPELQLKMLVVGGIDRVYEIGSQFRNEGMDLTHNPEFVSLEFYWAYRDYNDLMDFTEQMLSELVTTVCGSSEILYEPTGTPINFAPPYQRLRVVPELEKRLCVTFPPTLDRPEDNTFLCRLCKDHSVVCNPPTTTPRLLDALIATFLEPECIQPTFLCDHPQVMSPLAKYHREDSRLSERFELFINGKELVNAYTELNDPLVQRREMTRQMQARAVGDDEAMSVDETFLNALEYGLPPTAGFGLGIERLVMLLTSQSSIKEVLFFPMMKIERQDETKNQKKEENSEGLK